MKVQSTRGSGDDALAGLEGAAPAARLLTPLLPCLLLLSLPHSFIRRPDAPIYVLTGNAGAGFTHSFPKPANVPSWVAAGWQVRRRFVMVLRHVLAVLGTCWHLHLLGKHGCQRT